MAAVLLTLVILHDGLWTQRGGAGGRRRVAAVLLQAAGFLALALAAVVALLTRDRLPDPVVLDIRSWGILTITSMVSCFLVQRRLGAAIGLEGDHVFSLWVLCGSAAVVGARGLHVAVNWSDYAPEPLRALAFWDGGLVYIGGVTAAVLTALGYVRRHRLGARALDVLVLGIALTQGIGRIGCLLAGCCYGRPTALPWGVRFGEGSIAEFAMRASGALPPGARETPPLHPTQLYEALACTAIGLLLLVWYRRRSPRSSAGSGTVPGAVACGYFVVYPAARFLLEMLRNDPDRQFLVRIPAEAPRLLSTSQAAGLVLAAGALLALRALGRVRGAASASPSALAPAGSARTASGS